jgi:hypothetical protein
MTPAPTTPIPVTPAPANQEARAAPATAAPRLLRWVYAPRRFATLALVSLGIGAAHALVMLPIGLVLGTSDFWVFPRGLIGGSENDMAQVLTGQLFLQQGPWAWPLLQAPDLGFPTGTNLFWIDAVPIVALIAKLLDSIVHGPLNLLGFDLFACLVLPGIALTGLVWVVGHRHLLAAITASALADAAPPLLYRWGHIPLMAHYLIIAALGLYLLGLQRPGAARVRLVWLGLLAVTLLTNVYLFVIVGACWVAGLVQRRLNGDATAAGLAIEALVVVIPVLGLMAATGILSAGSPVTDLGVIRAEGFGWLSTNLGSLLVPQLSGVVPGLAHYQIGMGSQYEGFGYVGAGVLLLLLAGLPGIARWLRTASRHHAVLIALVLGSFLFALSNRVFLGSHLLVTVPVPSPALHLLGLLRSGGRFVWLPGYAIMAGSVVLALRRQRSWPTAALCLAAATLQMVDAGPLRAAIASAASGPIPAVFDRDAVAALAARADAIEAFPTYGCVDAAIDAGGDPASAWPRLTQANMELQLIAARAGLPINSVYQSRLPTDCTAEAAQRGAKLRPGTLYLYLDAPAPTEAQFGGGEPGHVCGMVDWLRYCLIPAPAQAGGAGLRSATRVPP